MIVQPDTRIAAVNFANEAADELLKTLRISLQPSANEEISILWRIKSEDSIAAKQKRRLDYVVINDFIGLKIVVLHIGLVGSARNTVRDWGDLRGLILNSEENRFRQPGLAHYRGVHLDFNFQHPERLGLTEICGIEVQITTYLQHFHSLASHALLYKQGGNAGSEHSALRVLTAMSDKLKDLDETMATLLRPSAA
jgi:ppGpp synthetase/RelA/SpoT-type nucleotidyltranferase